MAAQLASSLEPSTCDVTLLSLFGAAGTDMESSLDTAGIRTVFLDKKVGFDVRMFSRFDRIVREVKPHVVHTHRYVLRYCLPSLLRRSVPVLVHTVHNPATREVDLPGRILHRYAFKKGVVPVSIAPAVSQSMEETYQLKNIPLIPNGIPVEKYANPMTGRTKWRLNAGFTDSDTLFVCVGRLQEQKNPELLFDAFEEAFSNTEDCHLLMVGDGPMREQLVSKVAGLSTRDRVHFLGVRYDIPDILSASDSFALSSHWEGHPLALLEALAAGLPVVSTAVGGVPEIVSHGETGLLVEAGNQEAFVDALTTMYSKPETRKAFSLSASRNASAEFDVGVMASRYQNLYQRLLKNGDA